MFLYRGRTPAKEPTRIALALRRVGPSLEARRAAPLADQFLAI
jgi:hypothetical protein